ncbi:MAG: hypothetical protein K2G27_04155 [Duncaniella sp.]|nr:hypothetical protein [Duncaniella sp.]
MKKIFAILALLVSLLMSMQSCDNREGFEINCEIEGLEMRGLEMIYMTRGGVSRQSFHPVDGKVRLTGTSAQPTLVEVFTIDGTPLFACVAADGDRMKLRMKIDDPASLTISGQDASRDYAAFVTANDSLLRHGTDEEVNRLIAGSVRANPGSMASALLMVTRFRTAGHELLADSLLGELSPEARPAMLAGSYASTVGEQVSTTARGELRSFTLHHGVDTIVRYTPSMQSYVLMVFNDDTKPDSVLKRLRSLHADLPRRRLQVIEVSLTGDSARWRSQVKGDSAKWMQGWVPGGVSAQAVRRMSVPRTPFYIVADSTGAQQYRGTSLYAADTLLRSRLHIWLPSDSAATAR